VAAERVEYAALVAALPAALVPPPEAPTARGTFDARLEVDGPLLAPAAWHLAASLDLSRMREASRRIERQPLRGPFVHRLPLPDGAAILRGAGLVVGPENPDFVPVAELPIHVIRAVTASEDAGFFAHHGFDFAELGLAFAAGAEQGRVVRGGSTISQQVAKNLYLGRERTLARKVREAAVTLALEAALPKARILEIYLNVAEWGPGVHGIGPAARHWFGKDARALTPREAAFLATVIPNPVRYEYMRRRGLSPAWTDRVNELLRRMTEQGALSDEDLSRSLEEPLVFTEG
jgi:membrane peptidoglycan carboxypeptidase